MPRFYLSLTCPLRCRKITGQGWGTHFSILNIDAEAEQRYVRGFDYLTEEPPRPSQPQDQTSFLPVFRLALGGKGRLVAPG